MKLWADVQEDDHYEVDSNIHSIECNDQFQMFTKLITLILLLITLVRAAHTCISVLVVCGLMCSTKTFFFPTHIDTNRAHFKFIKLLGFILTVLKAFSLMLLICQLLSVYLLITFSHAIKISWYDRRNTECIISHKHGNDDIYDVAVDYNHIKPAP